MGDMGSTAQIDCVFSPTFKEGSDAQVNHYEAELCVRKLTKISQGIIRIFRDNDSYMIPEALCLIN